jgi:hypothetical protein
MTKLHGIQKPRRTSPTRPDSPHTHLSGTNLLQTPDEPDRLKRFYDQHVTSSANQRQNGIENKPLNQHTSSPSFRQT